MGLLAAGERGALGVREIVPCRQNFAYRFGFALKCLSQIEVQNVG